MGKNIALALFISAALLFGCILFPQGPKTISEDEFKLKVVGEDNFSIFMNVTGADSAWAVRIYQCGADLSGSLALLNKSITPFVLDGDSCVTLSGNTTASQCLQNATGYRFYLVKGNGTPSFHDSFTAVFVPVDYNDTCRIARKYADTSGVSQP